MAVRDVFVMRGQSNSGGTSPPPSGEAGADLASIPFWKDELDPGGASTSPSLGPLLGNASGGSGCTYTFGRLMFAAGFRPIIWNIYRGSTAANAWISGGLCYNGFITSLTNALAATEAAYPGDTFRFHHITDQGEYEARYGYPSPTGPEQAIIDAWPTNVNLTHAALESVVGKPASLIIVGTNYQLDGQNNPPAFRNLQRVSAAPDLFVTRDETDGVTYDDVAGLHPDNAGYVTYGTRLASAVASFLAAQGSLGAATRSAWVNHVRNKGALTAAATHYLHLYADTSLTVPLTGVTAPGYAPASNTNDATLWPASSDRAKSNGVAFTFPSPSGTWVSVRGWKLTDNATEGAGRVIDSGSTEPIDISAATGPLECPIGGMSIVAATGGFPDDTAHGIMDLEFGGAAFAQNATSHGSYWAGDPQGSGAQAGSRVAMTQATTFGSAAGGASVSVASVALAQQVTGTYWAEHDAGVGGALILSAPRPAAVGLTGTILAGQIQTVIT